MDSRIHEVVRILPELLFSETPSNARAIDNGDNRKRKRRWDRLLLEAAAEKVNLSPSHLRYLFRAEMKTTFKQYAEQLRMERAVKMAEVTCLTISQIMAEIGIGDNRSFRRKLKKIRGLTLSQHRKCRDEQAETLKRCEDGDKNRSSSR